ncbi:MAG: hypothetical protein K9L68_09570 [Spirochaetales bacterium]|nr:hypothetical protein [Spirochaetales bacterium]MCF7938833.1 hypothetical protein [Spirochaetales bacterium]
MRMQRLVVLVLLVFLLAGTMLSAQKVSEKKEIAVFDLSYYDWNIPSGALGAIDQQIQSVFINIGRFEVIGLNYRLGESDVNEFVRKIKQYKERQVEIPEEVRLGQEVFTEQDFNRLVGSFIVVIPSVSFFNVAKLEDGEYQATIQTSFQFVNVEESKTFDQFFVETTGTDDNARNAVKNAVDGIPGMLTYKIRSMPEFQINTGIIEVRGGEVFLELGRNMGIMKGDEYSVLGSQVMKSGQVYEGEAGLILIKDVQKEFSVGTVLYSDNLLEVGDQLREVPRLGVEFVPYLDVMLSVNDKGGEEDFVPLFSPGFRMTASRGFYSFKPSIGVEFPFRNGILILSVFGVLPYTAYVGGEITNIYLGRLQITPQLYGGISGVIAVDDNTEIDDDFLMTHLGGRAMVSVSYLIDRDTKIYIEGGGAFWYGTLEPLFDYAGADIPFFNTFYGPIIGAGVNIKL